MQVNLEGRYFVLLFTADYVEESGALAVFRVEKGKLIDEYHPADHAGILPICELQDIDAIKYLRRQRVKEAFSFHANMSRENFLGYTLEADTDDGWYRYEGIYDRDVDCHYYYMLKDAGVELKLFISF